MKQIAVTALVTLALMLVATGWLVGWLVASIGRAPSCDPEWPYYNGCYLPEGERPALCCP